MPSIFLKSLSIKNFSSQCSFLKKERSDVEENLGSFFLKKKESLGVVEDVLSKKLRDGWIALKEDFSEGRGSTKENPFFYVQQNKMNLLKTILVNFKKKKSNSNLDQQSFSNIFSKLLEYPNIEFWKIIMDIQKKSRIRSVVDLMNIYKKRYRDFMKEFLMPDKKILIDELERLGRQIENRSIFLRGQICETENKISVLKKVKSEIQLKMDALGRNSCREFDPKLDQEIILSEKYNIKILLIALNVFIHYNNNHFWTTILKKKKNILTLNHLIKEYQFIFKKIQKTFSIDDLKNISPKGFLETQLKLKLRRRVAQMNLSLQENYLLFDEATKAEKIFILQKNIIPLYQKIDTLNIPWKESLTVAQNNSFFMKDRQIISIQKELTSLEELVDNAHVDFWRFIASKGNRNIRLYTCRLKQLHEEYIQLLPFVQRNFYHKVVQEKKILFTELSIIALGLEEYLFSEEFLEKRIFLQKEYDWNTIIKNISKIQIFWDDNLSYDANYYFVSSQICQCFDYLQEMKEDITAARAYSLLSKKKKSSKQHLREMVSSSA